MSIRIIEEPDVHVTAGELSRYRQEYVDFLRYYCGPIPTLEEFIKSRKRAHSKEHPK